MKTANICGVLFTGMIIVGLPACTTVDLSQLAATQPDSLQADITKAQKKNIVERASYSLTSLFKKKGWCDIDPDTQAMTATNVLLNGIDQEKQLSDPFARKANTEAFSLVLLNKDLAIATEQIIRTTKAAEIYLTMADELTELNVELSQLETALLSAKQAETRFGKSIQATQNPESHTSFQILTHSIDSLKTITNAYGDRIRAQIAARGRSERS